MEGWKPNLSLLLICTVDQIQKLNTTDHDSNQLSIIKIDTSSKTVEVIRLDSFNLRN